MDELYSTAMLKGAAAAVLDRTDIAPEAGKLLVPRLETIIRGVLQHL